MVEVCEGELIHLQGRVMRIDGNKITMLPKHEDLKVSYDMTRYEFTLLVSHHCLKTSCSS